MRTKTVTVTMPEHVWGRLASLADDRNVRVSELLASAVENLVPQPTSDRVVVLARQGLADRDIARLLGLTNASVARRRRRAGLPANRRRL